MNLLICSALILLSVIFLLFLLIFFFLMDEPSLKVFYRTIGRDLRILVFFVKLWSFLQYCRFRNLSVVYFFNQNVKKYPNRVCITYEDEQWTYKQMDELSNKIAHLFIEQGYSKGDEVALLMENCPEYTCFWLGLAKIGVVTALINTNLKKESLAHSMNVITMKGLIFGQNFAETLHDAMPHIENADTSKFFCYSRKSEENSILPFPCKNLNSYLEYTPDISIDPETFDIGTRDKLLYIFTSGTTGFPKAAIITHARCFNCSAAIHYLINSYESRVFYNTLPLYHVAGTVYYMSVALIFEGNMVIKKKFSASNFWKDIVKHNVLICFYIGEICRYLMKQPKAAEEDQHSLEVMLGSGIKPDIWEDFQNRFRVKRIIDVYGATEGNVHIANVDGKIGSCGFLSRIFHKIQGAYVFKIDPETGKVMRNSKGLCIRCKPGEPGELIGKIEKVNPLTEFEGYLSTKESNKKIIRNCFSKGDMSFATGDIFVMDEDGYLFFRDRCGDTYRWKSENVSTTEVETIISKTFNLAFCIVYGVEIPGNEGRVGMAAIKADDANNMDFQSFYEGLANQLPAYAMPAFLRISNTLEETGTYKLRKVAFQEQGYNPDNIDDPLYALDAKKKTFVPLTRELYSNIIKGVVKF